MYDGREKYFFVLLRNFMKKMRKNTVLLLAFLSLWFCASAQTGGRSVYNFLNFSYSSRMNALGNNLISVYDDDPTLLMMNPSYIGERHHNNLALNFTNYFAGANYMSALYAYTFPKAGSFVFDVRGVAYGKFMGTDASGQETGYFSAGDYAVSVGWGRELSPNFTIGASMKLLLCTYESYTSFGFAVDVAGSYHNPDKNLSLTLLAKNIGSELKPFVPGSFELPPFDLQFAFSQRLQHVPIRYHISLHSLYRWNMNYYGDGNPFLQTDAFTNTIKYPSKAAQFFDNFFRHFVFGLEIEPSKYFSLQAAYNHNVHQEMKVLARNSLAGFSYGLSINVKGIRFGFSRLHYAPGATPNCFNFALDFGELSKMHQENKAKKLQRMTD